MNELFESSYLSAMSEMNNKLREENNKLQSNWNSLREWLEYRAEHTMQQHNYYGVLDKMNELEGGDND